MNSDRSSGKFKLVAIEHFDARRGYKRCVPPGVGVSFAGGDTPGANADFWRDRTGRLVVRFSSQGYVYHLAALRVSGENVLERDIDELGDYIADALYDWVCEGVDDEPNALYETPRRTT